MATALMLGGGTFAVVEGCSSSDTATPASTSSSSSSSSSSGDDDNTSSSSSSSSSSGSLFDATLPTTVPASNPGQYTCGTVSCDAGDGTNDFRDPPVCCQQPTGVTGTACVKSSLCNNEVPDAGLQVVCDESADCSPTGNGQQVCCYVKDVEGRNGDQTTFNTQCSSARDCEGFDDTTGNQFSLPFLCHSNSDCSDAGVVDSGTTGVAVACNQKNCDGFLLYVCGSPIGCQ